MNRLRLSHHNLRTAFRLAPITALAIIIVATLLFTNPPDTTAQPNSSGAPYIVSDGVKIIDAWKMTDPGWQAWLSRPPGDDTHGVGDLFVVGVTFNEPVQVNHSATFKIEVGRTMKTLVYAGQDRNTLWFGTTVPAHWHDYDGVRIGDNTETLDHNPADYFRHPVTGVNAVLTYAALGTDPHRKVTGEFSRPRVVQTEILPPECDSTYARDELVTVRITFNQPVTVRGTPQAVLKIRGANGQWRVRANYTQGTGSDTITLQYKIKHTDRERIGIRVDPNALLIRRDRAKGPLNRARILGHRGGLLADLRTPGLSRSDTTPVDGARRPDLYCLTNLPAGPATAAWSWTTPQPTTSGHSASFTVNLDPGDSTTETTTTYHAARMLINGQLFTMGITNGVPNLNDQGRQTRAAFCATSVDTAQVTVTNSSQGWKIVPPSRSRTPAVVFLPYEWSTGRYTMSIESTHQGDDGGRYRCRITNHAINPATGRESSDTRDVGTFRFNNYNDQPPKIDPHYADFGPAIIYEGPDAIRPINLPLLSVTAERPVLQDVPRPDQVMVFYFQPNEDVRNGLVTFDAKTGSITLTTGAATSHEHVNNNGVQYTYTQNQ